MLKANALTRNVYVASLPRLFNNANLRELFEPFGEIESAIAVMDDRCTVQRCKGYGFVLFKDPRAAVASMHALNDTVVMGRTIQVRLSQSPPPLAQHQSSTKPLRARKTVSPQPRATAVAEAAPLTVSSYRLDPYLRSGFVWLVAPQGPKQASRRTVMMDEMPSPAKSLGAADFFASGALSSDEEEIPCAQISL